MPHGKSVEKRDLILRRAAEILRREFRTLTTRREKQLLGFDGYHDPDFCSLCLLSELESWRVAS